MTTINKYSFIKAIGSGGEGVVWIAKNNEDNIYYAIKIISKSTLLTSRCVEKCIEERNILESITHPYINETYYAMQDSLSLYYVSNLCNDNLYNVQKRYFDGKPLPENLSLLYCSQLHSVLKYLHDENIVFRDLKLENILIDQVGHVRLTDFGLATKCDSNTKLSGIYGTPEYMSPEMIKEEPYDYLVDYWAFGIVMYELYTGYSPFTAESNVELFSNILLNTPKYSNIVAVDKNTVIDIISKLLSKDPSHRKSFIYNLTYHPFYRDIDWVKINYKTYKSIFIPNRMDVTVPKDYADVKNMFKPFAREKKVFKSPSADMVHPTGISPNNTKKYTLPDKSLIKKCKNTHPVVVCELQK